MNLINKSVIAAITSALVMTSTHSMASSGCYFGETDGSQWLESVIEPNKPLLINYNTSAWNEIEKFDFDFGYDKIENPRGFSVEVLLANHTTEAMSISGILEGESGASGGSNNAGRIELHMNLNSDRYFSRLVDGKLNLGLGRTGSNETIEVIKVTARFCGLPVQEGVAVSASDHNILAGNAQPLSHFIDADTTYRVSATGSATDENGNAITAVSINYIDSRNSENSTLQVNTGEEFYLHSNGKVSLYYATESSQNTGGHTVKFERVNLD
ncbi:conserved exported hypothetical protein [Vibrio chagasii]|uniref:hypothetical protein n=1 Tax=Vibrio chagasii TaxID=170679 RepID=UPI00337EF17C|nr:conserved exported hypothetical protein [Vibrio chagasii]CAH6845779.1 conserved exported hypothetical protein [Vibrio chagasii]CAH6858462.1 conserved exported hypothetical protein [Vibrio chagasii]CAH6867726.1 conserved exported hypothetical protein [Vibrio chagasii]CAH6876590.1 conserved exported hypothetical protein [Vibrio chagasii]